MIDSSNQQRTAFQAVLYDRLIPEFCSDSSRRCESSGFRSASVQIAEEDARYFLLGLDGGLIEHKGAGRYRTANSAATEQFFWEGPRGAEYRWFSLWLEPIITVAALARLHFDYGWPKELIGTQSADWTFDVVAFRPDNVNEAIAGEVKKTPSEIDHLIRLMDEFGRDPKKEVPTSGRARNAFKKVAGLRARHAPVFWAVGPSGLSKVHRVEYNSNGTVELGVADDQALQFAS
jgi:hypothetical protein